MSWVTVVRAPVKKQTPLLQVQYSFFDSSKQVDKQDGIPRHKEILTHPADDYWMTNGENQQTTNYDEEVTDYEYYIYTDEEVYDMPSNNRNELKCCGGPQNSECIICNGCDSYWHFLCLQSEYGYSAYYLSDTKNTEMWKCPKCENLDKVKTINHELITIDQKTEIISNAVNNLLKINNFIDGISATICEYICYSSELYIDYIAKIICSSVDNILDHKISSIIALYSGGYSWNENQNSSELIYSYNGRASQYTDSCPDGICCMSDININTDKYFCELIIEGKYDQMWLGITWNPDFATKYYSWDVVQNKETISYYGGRYRSEDKGYIQSEGCILHRELERYGSDDVIGIKVSNFEEISFYKNNEIVTNEKIMIPKDDNRIYWIFVMLDTTSDCVVFHRLG